MRLPLCERWYESSPVDPALDVIVEPHVDALLRSNTWLVRGRDRDLLIDTGNGIAPIRPFVDGLRHDRSKPLTALVTHGHMDHAGGLWEFDDRLAHHEEEPDLREPTSLIRRRFVWPPVVEAMAAAGAPLPDLLMTAAPEARWDPARFAPHSVAATRSVGNGDLVDLGDRTFEVLHLPGHTRGSIGLWEEATGTLFVGDAVYAEDPLIDCAPTSDPTAYLETIARLRRLHVRVVHAGHDRSMDRETFLARCDSYRSARWARPISSDP